MMQLISQLAAADQQIFQPTGLSADPFDIEAQRRIAENIRYTLFKPYLNYPISSKNLVTLDFRIFNKIWNRP